MEGAFKAMPEFMANVVGHGVHGGHDRALLARHTPVGAGHRLLALMDRDACQAGAKLGGIVTTH